MKTLNRRSFLGYSALAGAAFVEACASREVPQTISPTQRGPERFSPKGPNYEIRLFASSSACNDAAALERAIARLQQAGFAVTNTAAAFRRFSRFAGSDQERVEDFQAVVESRVPVPKIFLAVRGGYGAMRLLPHIDWPRLAAKMRETGSFLVGYSDVSALQLALMAKGNMGSFSGPMAYSDLGKLQPSYYTMHSFINAISHGRLNINVPTAFADREVEGIFWGGNLSVLSALVGTPYMPNVKGGILFIEEVGEQPYRIERMLETLYLARILQKQKAIVFGNFNMQGVDADSYDDSYGLGTAIANVARLTHLPVFTQFPFGHAADKVTMPLGYPARIVPNNRGYRVEFFSYPHIDARSLNLQMLLPESQPFFQEPKPQMSSDSTPSVKESPTPKLQPASQGSQTLSEPKDDTTTPEPRRWDQ